MTILYALVARGTVVLAEFSAASGNASTIARRILEKLPPGGDSRISYSQDRHIFHIMKADGLVFLCMANDTFGSKFPCVTMAHLFLISVFLWECVRFYSSKVFKCDYNKVVQHCTFLNHLYVLTLRVLV